MTYKSTKKHLEEFWRLISFGQASTRILDKWFNLRSSRWYVVGVPKCIHQRNTDTRCNCGCKWVCVLQEEKWGDRIIVKIKLEKAYDRPTEIFFFLILWRTDIVLREGETQIHLHACGQILCLGQWKCHRFAGKFKVWKKGSFIPIHTCHGGTQQGVELSKNSELF